MVCASEVRQRQVEQRAWYILWPDKPFKRLERPCVLAVFYLGAPDGLENVLFPRAGEIHHDLAIFSTKPKRRVIVSLDGHRSLVDVP